MLHQDIKPSDVISILRRRWYLIALLAVAGGAAGFFASHVLPKRFTSQTLVLVQAPTVSPSLVTPVVSDNSNQRLAAMQQQILSRSRLEPVIQQFGLYAKDIDSVPMDALVERLRSAVTITPVQPMAETRAQNLPGFYISVVFNDPHMAQAICARITNMFLEENVQSRQGQTIQTNEFLGKQLDEAKAKLDEQDARLAAFQRKNLGILPDEAQTNLNLLAGLTPQLEASTQALSRAQQDKSFAESQLAQQIAAWQATQSGQNPETLEQQLAALEAQLTTLQSKYTNDHPDVIKAKNDIATMRKKIAEENQDEKPAGMDKTAKPVSEPAQIQQLRAQIHQYDQVIKERTQQQTDIQAQIKLYQARVQASPAVEQEYKLVTRDHQTALDFYNDLLKKRDQSAMAMNLEQSQQGEQFQVLDPANLPNQPSFPKVPVFAGGGFAAGLALGLGLTLLLEMQDTSMRSERDVEAALHLPVLAMIPVISKDQGKKDTRPSLVGPQRPRAAARA
ncbi:MAG: lipopolysaccharide biosynthesis protein [Acidobacteriia bacterium]|nr:lipopolysaccharide biosynthesis protein [Terriglobia bacterium]